MGLKARKASWCEPTAHVDPATEDWPKRAEGELPYRPGKALIVAGVDVSAREGTGEHGRFRGQLIDCFLELGQGQRRH